MNLYISYLSIDHKSILNLRFFEMIVTKFKTITCISVNRISAEASKLVAKTLVHYHI